MSDAFNEGGCNFEALQEEPLTDLSLARTYGAHAHIDTNAATQLVSSHVHINGHA